MFLFRKQILFKLFFHDFQCTSIFKPSSVKMIRSSGMFLLISSPTYHRENQTLLVRKFFTFLLMRDCWMVWPDRLTLSEQEGSLDNARIQMNTLPIDTNWLGRIQFTYNVIELKIQNKYRFYFCYSEILTRVAALHLPNFY